MVTAPLPRAERAARHPRPTALSPATLLQAVAVASLSAGLLMHLAAAPFVRYVADDYSMASLLRDRGVLGGQAAWYASWSGRFSATAADLAALWLGPAMTRLVPVGCLTLWLVLLTWSIGQAGRAAGIALPRLSVVLIAEVVLFSTLVSAPDLFESVYWMTGAMTYTAPLILGTALAGLIAHAVAGRRRRPLLTAVGAALLALVAGGFSDSYVCAQTTAILVAVGMTLRGAAPRLRRERATLLAALAGSSLALVLVAVAPGNAVRSAFFPPHPSLLWVASWSARYTALLTADTVIRVIPLIAALAVAATVATTALRTGAPPLRPGRRHLAVLVVAPSLVAMAAIAPAFWGTSAPPPPRALLIPVHVLVAAAAAGGAMLGLVTPRDLPARRPLLVVSMAAVAIAPALAAVSIVTHLDAMAHYAAVKDGQVSALLAARRAGRQHVALEAAPTSGLGVLSYDPAEEIARDPSCWVNRAVAAYYGVPTVTADRGPAPGSC